MTSAIAMHQLDSRNCDCGVPDSSAPSVMLVRYLTLHLTCSITLFCTSRNDPLCARLQNVTFHRAQRTRRGSVAIQLDGAPRLAVLLNALQRKSLVAATSCLPQGVWYAVRPNRSATAI